MINHYDLIIKNFSHYEDKHRKKRGEQKTVMKK